MEYLKSESTFSQTPTLSLSDQTISWTWTKEQIFRAVVSGPDQNGSIRYCVDGNLSDKLSVNYCMDLYRFANFLSWEEYKQFLHCYHFVDNESGAFRCSCAMFMKLYKCKHCIGIRILFHNLDVDERAKTQLIGKKRKRGRPSNVPSALVSL